MSRVRRGWYMLVVYIHTSIYVYMKVSAPGTYLCMKQPCTLSTHNYTRWRSLCEGRRYMRIGIWVWWWWRQLDGTGARGSGVRCNIESRLKADVISCPPDNVANMFAILTHTTYLEPTCVSTTMYLHTGTSNVYVYNPACNVVYCREPKALWSKYEKGETKAVEVEAHRQEDGVWRKRERARGNSW